jgi:hypothetical protein
MNGISSTLKEEIQKSKDSKKKEQTKFILAIIATNIMVAILCLPSGQSETETKKLEKLTHLNHEMMVLPLEVLVPESEKFKNEIVVTLVSKNKKVIVEKAYLHEELAKKSDLPQFKIEIPSIEIVKVSDAINEAMVAIPYVEKLKTKKIKRGSKYEINL